MSALPGRVLTLLMAGGVLYTVGVVFHLWERLPYQNAIWHGFVLVGGNLPFRCGHFRHRRLTACAEKPKHSRRSTLR